MFSLCPSVMFHQNAMLLSKSCIRSNHLFIMKLTRFRYVAEVQVEGKHISFVLPANVAPGKRDRSTKVLSDAQFIC